MAEFSSVEIPKPLDWQAFQRGCVALFRKLVGDPSLAEFGRSGQTQHGIDLLGYRAGSLDKPVGIQCRRTEELSAKDIRKAANQARVIRPALTELIFATTAKHDANLQKEALSLTEELKNGGWPCRVTVYGWEVLQAEIANCHDALQLFWPTPKANEASDLTALIREMRAEFKGVTEAAVLNRSASLFAPIDSSMPAEALLERRDVHELISAYRDLLIDGKTETAISQLEKLKTSISGLEPYARFRIETNIGAAHLRAGRPVEALAQMRQASAIRPTDPKARANVALGMFATGDSSGALALAKEILAENPAQSGALVVLVQTIGPDVDPYQVIPPDALQDADVVASLISVLRNRSDKRWHAPGFVDTEIGVTLNLEGRYGTEKVVHAGVQA
jgi:cellulose synthase operon protein C